LGQLGLNLGYLLIQILMFAITVVVLRAWVFKPILGLLDKRRKAIAQGLEDARVAAEARANAEREAEHIVADAQAKAAQIIRESTERAENAAVEIKAANEAEVNRMREIALAEIEQERNRILSEVRGQVAALAVAAAQKLVGELIDERRHRALLEEFFSGVKDGKVTILADATANASVAEVTSALPLTQAEQELVMKDLMTRSGGKATVNFRVDPSILGGLVVRLGDKVMDGSVAGQLQSLREHLS
jgi:F-type H+-transporting ATPase subunit b